MLAALSVIAGGWRDDPAARTVLRLGEQSRDAEVRAKMVHRPATSQKANPKE
jgi:hypothetical protein